MRVLFVSAPGVGHVFPLVPLAWALRTAGHDVMVGTTGAALKVAEAGLPVADVAPGFDMAEIRRKAMAEHPEFIERIRNTKITDPKQALWIFARLAKWTLPGTVELADTWRPDLVVHSQLNAAGPLIAARLGVPAVEQGFGFARSAGMHEALREELAEDFEQYQAAELPATRVALDVAPPSMITDPGPDLGDLRSWPARYVPYNGGAVLPAWVLDKPERRRIAVTLGTVAPQMNGLGSVERLVAAAAEVDAEFILALGDADITGLGTLPDNVRSAGWVPLRALLANSDALVHHGGAGTTLTALDAGLPQLVLPDGADRHINAAAVGARGAGLVSTAADLDAALLDQLLNEDSLRRAADEVRAEIATLPSPTDLVPRLTTLLP